MLEKSAMLSQCRRIFRLTDHAKNWASLVYGKFNENTLYYEEYHLRWDRSEQWFMGLLFNRFLMRQASELWLFWLPWWFLWTGRASIRRTRQCRSCKFEVTIRVHGSILTSAYKKWTFNDFQVEDTWTSISISFITVNHSFHSCRFLVVWWKFLTIRDFPSLLDFHPPAKHSLKRHWNKEWKIISPRKIGLK